jgi:hypothetical protein
MRTKTDSFALLKELSRKAEGLSADGMCVVLMMEDGPFGVNTPLAIIPFALLLVFLVFLQ